MYRILSAMLAVSLTGLALSACGNKQAAQQDGIIDVSLGLPRGARDEEFHAAVTELLSDWGATVADPEVEAVRVVAVPDDALTQDLRDLLVRMGMPHHPAPTVEANRYCHPSLTHRTNLDTRCHWWSTPRVRIYWDAQCHYRPGIRHSP